MEKKAFANWTGKDRHLTRDEFITEWLDHTIQFGTLFGGDSKVGAYLDFRDQVAIQAGKKWDNAK
jgi:hypothetical protein